MQGSDIQSSKSYLWYQDFYTINQHWGVRPIT